MHRIQIQRPKSKFWKIFFTIFTIFQNSKFWFFLWWKSTSHTFFTFIPAFFDAQRPKPPLQALPCIRDGPWPLISFFDLWRSNCDLGQKVYWSNFLIIFDGLSNAVCPSFLALLVTKIAGEDATFCLGGQFWKWNSPPRHFLISTILVPIDSEWTI